MENKEKVEKVEKNSKKNYSIIIAIALIAVLVVAMLCIGCNKKNTQVPSINNDGNTVNNEVNLDDVEEELPNFDAIIFPEHEENIERDEEGNKINVSPNIKDGMTFEFLELSNISLKYGNGTTTFTATAKNTTDKEHLLGVELEITFYDNAGREIYKTHMLTSAIYANKETTISTNMTMDCSYADTFDIKVIEHDM